MFSILSSSKGSWFAYTTCSRPYVDISLRRSSTLSVLFLDLGTSSQSERRLYILRDQLKVQFHATQRAQINERKAADSKRRLTSCVAFAVNDCMRLIRAFNRCRYVFHDKSNFSFV